MFISTLAIPTAIIRRDAMQERAIRRVASRTARKLTIRSTARERITIGMTQAITITCQRDWFRTAIT